MILFRLYVFITNIVVALRTASAIIMHMHIAFLFSLCTLITVKGFDW